MFYVQIFLYKRYFSSYVLALSENLHKEFAHLMLMKLTAGVNFINVLRAAFSGKDPKSAKKD